MSVSSDVVGRRGGRAAAAGPVGVEELAARLVDALVGVGAEVVALGLEQVRGQAAAAVAVEVGQGGCIAGSGMPFAAAVATTRRQPSWPGSISLAEVRIEQQVRELRVAVERLLDLAEERRRG